MGAFILEIAIAKLPSRRVSSLAYWIKSSSKSSSYVASHTWNFNRSRFSDYFISLYYPIEHARGFILHML